MSKTYSEMLFSPNESTDEKEEGSPSPTKSDSIGEAHARITVGWLTTPIDVRTNNSDLDRSIVEFTTHLGQAQYNFIAYPVGGVKRAFWTKSSENAYPPRIDLPDMQLANHLWDTYVCGQISPWIDCDSEDESWNKFSEEELVKELNYVCYLGLRTILLSLRRKMSPRLAKIINKWLWTKNLIFTVWIVLPSSLNELLDYNSNCENGDLWSVWADFRTMCTNHSGMKLQASISISADLPDEFTDSKLVERWKAEPIGSIIVNSDVFVTDKNGLASLPESHMALLRRLWMSDEIRIMLQALNDNTKYNKTLKQEYAEALKSAVRNVSWLKQHEAVEKDGFLASSNIEYYDMLQAPLQPLSDNLDSGVYNTFEQDPIKYKKYREAVELALKDFGETIQKPRHVVVYLLGAGRGPLARMILEAEKLYNNAHRTKKDRLKVKLYVVEKNTNAIVTLNYMNERCWRSRATIIESDMRSLPKLSLEKGYEKPDIIVSELLGSFGDNELSPECLDGVTDFLKPTTISIPQKYTSYAAPIMSLFMHQTIKSTGTAYWSKGVIGHGRNDPEQQKDGSYTLHHPQGIESSRLDQIYVVYLHQYCSLADTQPVFSFEHPNFEKKSNERSSVVEFEVDRFSDLMGFAGYFDLILYKDVMLSIEPNTYSKTMVSWFPAVIPLRDLYRTQEGDKVRLIIDRKVDATGVWYEWHAEIQKKSGDIQKTPLQNPNGESYYMRM